MKTTSKLNYRSMFKNMPDPRMRHWPLVDSPVPLAIITAVYLTFVTVVGPRVMASKKPLSFQKLILAVNVFQVLINMWIVWEMGDCGWFGQYTFWCQPMDHSTSPTALRMARATWVFFAVKLFDLLDTVFFVLRKKDEQVSFLHLFHHVTTLWLSWLVCKYAPGGHGTFAEMLNAFIHVIMYVYYLLSALGPNVQRFLWWKKYLTTAQMGQFVVTWVQNLHAQFTGCTYNRLITQLYNPIITITFLLFFDFYRRSYVNNGGKRRASQRMNPPPLSSSTTSSQSLTRHEE
ncbi:very long chain fatty acid elongase 1-like [Hetaerina americana]|uniref:very long chain fatty acid elongase 1-like n=1 Tax=Hetaerina americana TaxID=62018 RepID=UPI003A7F2E6E